MRWTRKAGAALVLVVAVLTILALLAVSLARLMQVERAAARSYSDSAQAQMAAEAGIEFATTRLRDLAASQSYEGLGDAWVYGGEDFDGNGVKSSRNEESFANGEFDLAACPIEYALRPSFALFEGGLPVLEPGNHGISGTLELPDGHRGGLRAVFVLRVLDAASQIDVNGGLGDPQASAAIARMIDHVWESVASRARAIPDVEEVGEFVISRRPGTGYESERKVRETLAAIVPGDPRAGDEVFRSLAPYLACEPWRDPTVIVPRGRDRIPADGPPEPRTISAEPQASYDSLERRARAPINLNTAEEPVLYACLADLAGWAFLEGVLRERDPATGEITENGPWYDPATDYRPDEYWRVEIAPDLARTVAGEIARERRERGVFKSWNEVDAFLDKLTADRTLTPPLTRLQADLIRANAHPDTDLNKFTPDSVAWRSVDKSDLLVHTTEWCLSSMGRFEIESLGIVFDGRGEIRARSKVVATARIYDVVRDTTLAEFRQGSRSPEIAGLGRAIDFYPEARNAVDPEADGQVALGAWRPELEWPKKSFRSSIEGGESVFPSYDDGGGGSTISEKHGAICFWYKPNWDIGSVASRPHSILDLSGDADDSTFQISNANVIRWARDPSREPRRAFLRLLAWDRGNRREVVLDPVGWIQPPYKIGPEMWYPKAEIAFGMEKVARARHWLHVSIRWDDVGVVMHVRGRQALGSDLVFVWPQYQVFSSAPPYFSYEKTPEGDWRIEHHYRLEDYPDLPWPDPARPNRFKTELEARRWPESFHYFPSRAWDDDWRSEQAIAHEYGYFGRYISPQAYLRGLYMGPRTVRFGFNSDPTAALRLGGRLGRADPVFYERPPGPPFIYDPKWDEPPDYEFLPAAPSSGVYQDLWTFEIEPFDGWIPEGDPASVPAIDRFMERLFLEGRYYGRGDASFLSRALPIAAGTRLGTISWKAYVPSETIAGSLEVRVLGSTYRTPEGGPLNAWAPAEASLRYEVRFDVRPRPDMAMLETPFLDSVTLTVLSPVTYPTWDLSFESPPSPWRNGGS